MNLKVTTGSLNLNKINENQIYSYSNVIIVTILLLMICMSTDEYSTNEYMK